ncbi:MAG: PAS domain-containing protein [Mariprofundaceae bacterium]
MIDQSAFPLLDHMTSGLLAIDRQARVVLWNSQLEQWTDIPRADILGKDLFEVFPDLSADAFKLRIEQVLSGSAPVIFSPQLHHHTIPCPLPEGGMRIQKTTVSWLPEHQLALFCIDEQTEQQRLISQHRQDTRELKQELLRGQELEKRNAHLLEAIEQAGEAIIITNRAGDIEYVNSAFYQQTGWNEEETRAIAVYDGLFSDRSSHFEKHINDVFAKGQSWQGRQDIIRSDGTTFTASISIAPISNESEHITHAIIIQEDISRQLEIERKLRDTQKQEALVTLVGGIAHDFNNILAGMTGQTYLAAREVKDMPKTAERMQKLQKLAQEAAEIVAQLLTFARQGQVNNKEMPLGSFLKEFCKLAAHNIPESIRLVSNIPHGQYDFRGDANQLQQALLNIVHNAVEACGNQHDGVIEIGLSNIDSETDEPWFINHPVLRKGHFMHLYIKDNGAGIAADALPRIFDPFYSTKQLGSGLGLAMVMGCIRHHHGLIDVQSTPGQGTTLHIFLPRRAQQTAETAKTPAMELQSADILLVDDDPRVLEPARELLEAMGHRITLAEDGKQAWEIFQQRSEDWDILITDMVMPHMNGLESSQLMRGLRPDLPIIYATAYDQSLVLDDTRKITNSVLLTKPFNLDDLDHLIAEMTGAKNADVQSKAANRS